MQIRSYGRSSRQSLWLFGLFASLLTAFAQTDGGVAIAPVPNQILYVGGPSVVVPLQVTKPPGAGYTLSASNARGTTTPRMSVTYVGTTNWMLTILAPTSNQGLEVPLGNFSIRVSALKTGTTNVLAQTTFVLTLLPAEFTGSQFLTDYSVMAKGLWVDLDGNGFLDFTGLAISSPSVFLERNSGGVFSANARLAAGLSTTGVVPADFDGDGRIDLLLLGIVDKPLFVNRTAKPSTSNPQLNIPFTFTNAPLTLRQQSRTGAAWADLDGDGDLDLILTGPVATTGVNPPPQQFRNDAGVLVAISSKLPGASGPVVMADFDGDGATDVLLFNTGETRDIAMLLRNDGNGNFTDTGTGFPTGQVIAAGWSDFNGDGRPDVWMQFQVGNVPPYPRATTELALFQQTTGGFFETLRLPAEVMRQAGAPAWGDFDNDGTPDFIAPMNSLTYPLDKATGRPATNSSLTIWHNDGAGHFTPHGFVATNSSALTVVAGDANGDGALDVALLSGSGLNSGLFVNPNRPANLPPSMPGRLQAFSLGTSLFLFWGEATDPNQTAPLTYNLRVGTTPGGNDIVASMSVGDGTRQVVAPGNCAFGSSRMIRLPVTNVDSLYWSVQAVDNSFVGGPFAPEQVLALNLPGNQPPILTGLTSLTVAVNHSGSLPFTVTDDRTPPDDITLSVQVSNPDLFPAGSVTITPKANTDPGSNPSSKMLLLKPPLAHIGEADVTLIATDLGGLSATNVIHVAVVVPLAPGLETRPSSQPGELTLRLKISAGTTAQLEQSSDLVTWHSVFDLGPSPAGETTLTLSSLPSINPQRFYRLRVLE